MPQNPADYIIERVPNSLAIAAAKIQEVLGKMHTVNVSGRGSYSPEDMVRLEDMAAALTAMTSRLEQHNAAVRKETDRYNAEARREREAREAARTRSPEASITVGDLNKRFSGKSP